MRLSRPCYDKPHRCPRWIGGGMRYPKRDRCDDGRIQIDYTTRWTWRFWRCNTCDVVTLPYNVQYLDWRYWAWKIRSLTRQW